MGQVMTVKGFEVEREKCETRNLGLLLSGPFGMMMVEHNPELASFGLLWGNQMGNDGSVLGLCRGIYLV